MSLVRFCAFVALFVCSACQAPDRGGSAQQTPSAPARAAPASAPSAVCVHGVLASICTKCNPKLIPVFQAKGDFCAEHGFPESVCPICNPDAGGKPQRQVTNEDAPADGLKLRFKRGDTARLAGIEHAPVELRVSGTALVAPARLSYDARKLARINARSPGVVRDLRVDIGTKVKRGQSLVVIDSPSVGADRARLEAAKSRVAAAAENLNRQQSLMREGVTSRQNVLAAEQELETAKAEQSALAASLSVLGANASGPGAYTLTAPLAGVVTERRVTIGQSVGGDDVLLEIVDTSSMWADVEIGEKDLPRVRAGQPVTFTFDALAGRELTGTIDYLAPALDPHTRTAKARVPLPNDDGLLRANLFGYARVAASDSERRAFVPRDAVQRSGDVQFVFVRLGELEYEVRRVKSAASDAQWVEITSGLEPGERVVTTGSFLLKTETSKERIGAGCCEH